MKNKRQEKIIDLVTKNDIQTQEELMALLKSSGFDVTQATVSRDIKDLKLIKISVDNKNYKYSTGIPGSGTEPPASRFVALCTQNAVGSDFAMNICVIKCMSGTANAVCAAIDTVNHADIVGTLAGDDTIFVLFKTEDDARMFSDSVKNIIGA